MDILPREDGALIAPHEATAGGLALGSRLTIPPGFAGVVVKDGKALDTLAAGDHLLEPSLLPGLTQKVKPRFGAGQAPDGTALLPAAVFLAPVGRPVSLPWRTQTILSKNPAYGLTYTTLEGRGTVQIADPARFCAAVFGAGSKALSAGQASPDQVAREFLCRGVSARVAEAVQAMNLPPDQAPGAREAIRAAAGQAVALWLSGVGVQCTAFDLDAVAAPDRTPCAGCGSRALPTGYGHFHRTISLLYVRFTAQKEGNFCVPCAWKISAGYNSVMLVAGWWGIIGLIMTPVYFAQNLYYLNADRDRTESRASSGASGRSRGRHLAAPAEGVLAAKSAPDTRTVSLSNARFTLHRTRPSGRAGDCHITALTSTERPARHRLCL